MGKNYKAHLAERPKRRRLKDNPYRIYCLVDEMGLVRYFVSFKDVSGDSHNVEVNRELFELFSTFELEDIAFMNEVDRHYDRFSQAELCKSDEMFVSNMDLESDVIEKLDRDTVWLKVQQLSVTQQKRLKLYCMGFTYEQIANKENCSVPVVAKSIKAAKKKIREYMENFEFDG